MKAEAGNQGGGKVLAVLVRVGDHGPGQVEAGERGVGRFGRWEARADGLCSLEAK